MSESLEPLANIQASRTPPRKQPECALKPEGVTGEPFYSTLFASSQMLPSTNEKRLSALVPKPSEATLYQEVIDLHSIKQQDSGILKQDREESQLPPKHVIPDGGLRAWSTVFGAFLVIFCTFGYFNAFGVYEAYYVNTFLNKQTSSTISWIGSVQLCLQFAFGLFSGQMFDLGYFHYLLGIGSVIYTLCLFMLSLAKENQYYQVILSQGVGLGIGLGIVFVPSISVVNHHFFRRRALATGIVFSGSSVGGLIFPIMLNKLFERTGFVWTVRASAFLVLGLLIIANFCMSTHLPPKEQRPPKPPIDIRKIVTDKPYIIGVVGGFFVQWGLFFPFFYLQLFAELHGVSETLSFYTVAILNAGSIFGRLLPNFLADKFGVMNLLIPCAAAMGVLIFSMFGATTPGGVVVFSILYGFFSGGFISLLGLMFVTMADGVHEIGIRIGLAFLVIAFAALTGTPIDGALLGRDFVWHRAIIFSGVVVFFGTGLLVISRSKMVQKKGTSRV